MMAQGCVVLLPALLCNAGLFIHQIKAFKDRVHFFVPDLSQDSDIQATAKRILNEIPADKFALGGISMGGYVAFEMIRQAPERILTLCLMDTNPFGETPASTAKRTEMMETAQTEGLENILEASLFNVLAPQNRDNDIIKQILPHMAQAVGLQGYLNEQKVIMSRPDSRQTLSDIACPTLVIGGQQDALSTPDMMEKMAKQIPNAVHALIANSGHFPPLENPAAMTSAFKYWLFR